MKANQEVIEKLKKILILANDKGAQPGEVEAAMAKAKEIAMRHAIDIASIDISAMNDDGSPTMTTERVDVKPRSKKPRTFHRFIVGVLHRVFGITVIHVGNQYAFVGESTDVAIAQALFPYLEDVFCQTYWRGMKAGLFPRCTASENAAYLGLYKGIIEANKRAEEQLNTVDKSKWAVVLVNKEALVKARVEQEFPYLRKVRNRNLSTNSAALNHGYNEGRKINLHQVNSSNADRRQIG